MKYCKCYKVLTVEEATQHLLDELDELHDAYMSENASVETVTDEHSDVAYAVNRLAGAKQGVEYMDVVDGDGRHKRKMERRMQQYGCIRSFDKRCTKPINI